MFELVERNRKATGRRFGTVILSIVLHVVVIGAFVVLPLLVYTDQLPSPPDMIRAYVAAPPPPAPPPPPPPPAAAAPQPKPVPTTGQQQSLAPVDAPPKVAPEVAQPPSNASANGVPGGVVGGIAGGVAGGTVGGIPDAPPASQAPVRVGGNIKAPAQTHNVPPAYPPVAKAAHVSGVVIVEATVGKDGAVQSARVLRGNPLLDQAALDAVKQWRYSPLMLNGQATPFILTVTVTFALQ